LRSRFRRNNPTPGTDCRDAEVVARLRFLN
jgi:hypothetical protein